jgi:hypothetical protein
MARYDGPEYTLAALTLSANTFASGAAEGTVIGNIVGKAHATDSTLSLVNDSDGQVKLVGDTLQVGPTATPDAGTITVVIRETNLWGDVETRDTGLNITVT